MSVTGIGVADQVVMCHGARLDPAKPLAAYKLPVVRDSTHGQTRTSRGRAGMTTQSAVARVAPGPMRARTCPHRRSVTAPLCCCTG